MHEVGRGRRVAFERRSRDRHERHDERIDAERDQLGGNLQDRIRRVAKPGQNIGGDLPAPEYGHGGLIGAEIALDGRLRLAGHDARAKFRRDDFEMHAERVDAGSLHATEPFIPVGRLALRLNREIDRGFHRARAVAQDLSTAIAAARRSRRHNHMFDVVEFHCGVGDFRQLTRRLALYGSSGGKRLSDGAELARLRAALIADAALQYSRRQHVAAMQRCDLPVGHALGGGEIVEAWSGWKADFPQRGAVAPDAARAGGVRFFDRVRALKSGRSMDRRHEGHAVDSQRLMIGRTGAATAALDPRLGINQPNAVGLQRVDQLFGRKSHGNLHRGVVGPGMPTWRAQNATAERVEGRG